MNGFFKSASLWVVLLIILVLAATNFSSLKQNKTVLLPQDFKEQLDAENIKSIDIKKIGDEQFRFVVQFKELVSEHKGMDFEDSVYPEEWRGLLEAQGLPSNAVTENRVLTSLLINILPLIIIIGLFWFFMIRQMQGGSNKAMSFGKSRARLVNQSDKPVTFDDVAGVDEAKEELQEIIEFLKEPKKFTKLGGKIPKGVLLVGPPGSGKTLLAKAVAGEAGVPFFSISGSDFVEMFVGVGASRVRDLFQQGQKNAPSIIFIDEIDAVGRQRGAGLGGGHDEREQTLNQLLVEMDGFNTSEGVILMAATNRPDVLDRALLRPGRFDRQIVVANPDINGREAIFNVHIRNNEVPLNVNVAVRKLARGTPGFSGADLANMVNEAALLAARRSQEDVTMQDFEDAKDRVLMGPERRSLVVSTKEKRITAVHEAGHAMVCRLLPDADPVHKVTVIPRGPSLGATSWLPVEDRHNLSKSYCMAMIRVAMGGRAAEEIVFDEFTSGASNDLKQATNQVHSMVCQWGMSKMGPVSFGSHGEVFLGRDFVKERDFSEETASAVDKEIRSILGEAYADAKALILKHRDVLDAITEELIERETLSSEGLDDVIRNNGGSGLIPPPPEKKEPPVQPEPIEKPSSEPIAAEGGKTEGPEEIGSGDVVPGTV